MSPLYSTIKTFDSHRRMNPKPSRRTLNPLSEIHISVDLKPFIIYSR
ncbi:unnamed protein product [Brassica oleracea var. botrytis]